MAANLQSGRAATVPPPAPIAPPSPKVVQYSKDAKFIEFPTDLPEAEKNIVNAEFNKKFYPLHAIDRDKALKVSRAVLRICREAGRGDLASNDPRVRSVGRHWCAAASQFFHQNAWLPPAKAIWLQLWDSLGERQLQSGRRVSRAAIAQLLTQTENEAGHVGEMFRWALLTHADEALGDAAAEGAFSKHWLHAFGISDDQEAFIARIARKCRGSVRGDWSSPAGFAEEVIRLCCEAPGGDSLLMRASLREEFPLSRSYLSALVRRAKTSISTHLKGSSLEELASYLFLSFGGCIPQRNVLDQSKASEHDLVVFNYAAESSAFAARFGRQFLVECKNLKTRVDVSTVGYFLHRMHLTRCQFGVILAAADVTGKVEATNARSLIKRAFDRDGAICVVVTMKDIECLCQPHSPSLTSLLTQLANELQFGKRIGKHFSS